MRLLLTLQNIAVITILLVGALSIYFPEGNAVGRPPALALDGFWSMCPNPASRTCFTFDAVATLTTTHPNDVIILVAQSKGGGTVVSVADDGGHNWKLRTVINGAYNIWEFYTIVNSTLSAVRISVTWDVGPSNAHRSFVVFGISGANTRHPWEPNFPMERLGWNGSSVALSAPGYSSFVIVSTAVNDAPPCYFTTDISPFQNIGEIGWGVYGEADYYITNTGTSNVSFSCNPYSDPMTFLADALLGPGPV